MKRTASQSVAARGTKADVREAGGRKSRRRLHEPRNALLHTGEEGMREFVNNMVRRTRRWWEKRYRTTDLSSLWEWLQQCLFKKVTKQIPEDLWRKDSEEGSSWEATGVSQEYAAMQIAKVLQRREMFLTGRNLPGNHSMNDEEKDAFVQAAKTEFHGTEQQLALQRDDLLDPEHGESTDWLRRRKRSRFERHKQMLAGSTAAWTVISFHGLDWKRLMEAMDCEPKKNERKPETAQSGRNGRESKA